MIIHIKQRNRLPKRRFGVVKYLSPQRVRIEVSLERNTSLAEYSLTLLHELLHVWLEIIKSNGAVTDKRNEHKFIYAVERQIIQLVSILKRG